MPANAATPVTSPVIEQQLAHKSVRKYLDTPVTDAQVEAIVRAAQQSSTSSSLQVVTVVAVRDQDRKNRISKAIGDRDYVENASVFLVWVADFARNAEVIRAAGQEPETFGMMENTLMSSLDIGIMSQSALLAAESLGLGGVFVGSIRNNPAAVSAELGLPEYAFPVVGMSIGVPDPAEGTGQKPRLPLEAVLHHETYDSDAWKAAAAKHEDDYRDYYESQGVPNRSWARTVTGRLAKPEGLHGRHTMRDSLNARGFATE